MNDTTRNIIRTAVPAIVGAVASWVTKVSAHLTPTETAIVFPIGTTVYYSIIRTLENKFPKFAWLLGCLPVKAHLATITTPATPAPADVQPVHTPQTPSA
jgi:hypothetical protein